jgi:phage tail-like protein
MIGLPGFLSGNQNRSYSSAHFILELDGSHIAGFFRSVEGGGVKADVMTYQMGNAPDQWRQLAKPKYDDLKIQVGMSMSQEFYGWISRFFNGTIERRNGAIISGDFHYKERARRVMKNMLISEVQIPKFDASDRAPCYMTVGLVPETVEFEPGNPKVDLSPTVQTKQKLWTPNRFEFTINRFEQCLKRVTKIEGFTIKQQILEYRSGNLRDPWRVPGRIEFPNLTFFLPEADAGPLIDHFTKRVLRGEPPPHARLTGGITALDSENWPLCTISLGGIDISSIGPDKSDSTSQEIKQVKVDITCESMSFQYHRSTNPF